MKRKQVIWLHLLFWVLLTVGNVMPPYLAKSYFTLHQFAPGFSLFCRYFLISIGFTTIATLCFYGSYLLVAPLLFTRKKYLLAVVAAIGVMVATGLWRYFMEFSLFKPLLGFDNYRGNHVSMNYYVNNIFGYYFPRFFVYGLMYFFVESWYKTQQRQQELQKEKATSELTFLRSQINPHFLFNTINDIYSLSYQQSEKAPTALLKLSEILRYMLREGKEDKVPLQSELNYLENVIELQQISSKGTACIDFNVEGYIGGQKIASLLLIAFVENAFKHGVLNDPQNPVSIHLQATSTEIRFSISNKKNRDEKDKTGGIGLSNVKRRLELTYPESHSLVITDENEFYTVDLSLVQV